MRIAVQSTEHNVDCRVCRNSTTIRVSTDTSDSLRQLADDDKVTLDEEITRLVRSERQRRIGQALAADEADARTRDWLDIGIVAARHHAGG